VLKAIRKLNSVSQNDGVAAIKVRVLQGMLLKQGTAKNSIFQCHFEACAYWAMWTVERLEWQSPPSVGTVAA
jgi:hypothetical protein